MIVYEFKSDNLGVIELSTKYVEIIIIFVFLGIILASFNMIYGQSPAQANNATSYRTELESYVNLHNISFSNANGGNHLNISDVEVLDLETSVKSHQSGL